MGKRKTLTDLKVPVQWLVKRSDARQLTPSAALMLAYFVWCDEQAAADTKGERWFRRSIAEIYEVIKFSARTQSRLIKHLKDRRFIEVFWPDPKSGKSRRGKAETGGHYRLFRVFPEYRPGGAQGAQQR